MSKDFLWAPTQPTDDMVRAGMGVGDDNCLYWKHPQQAYVDMLAAAPQPPALGGEPEVSAYLIKHIDDGSIYCITQDKPRADRLIADSDYVTTYLIDRAHLAPLQAEIDQLKAESERQLFSIQTLIADRDAEKAMKAKAREQRDQLKARCDELHRMLGLAWGSGDVSAEDCRKIDAALSKPAGSEQV